MRIEDFNLKDDVGQTLHSYSQSGNFPQTILVEGADVETRHNFAKMLANMIVCTGGNEKPCGRCNACVKCESGNHPDIKEYSGEKPTMTFKVEQSREIKADAFIIPNDGERKVYILLETQNMNDSAANAMLKVFEEPPRFDYFIMTCPGRSAMLPTVLSRATVINIGHNEAQFDEDTVTLAENLATAVCATEELPLMEELAKLINGKDMFLDVIAVMKRIYIDALEYKRTQKNTSDYTDVTELVCTSLAQQRIYAIIGVLGVLGDRFTMNANYNLLITSMSGQLRAAAGK